MKTWEPHRALVALLLLQCLSVYAAQPSVHDGRPSVHDNRPWAYDNQPSAYAAHPLDPAVEAKVDRMIQRLTLEQKIDVLGGVDGFYARGIPEIGLPKLKMDDGPVGARNDGPSTAMAGGIGLAATWNPALAHETGLQIGRDARARGVHFMLGPGVNIYKSPRNGRNFEYFGEDPFLTARLTVAYIEGMQSQGVSATVKHFLGNNSEFDRHNVDSVIDERSLRELYLPAFEAAVKEGHVGAIMDSYNLTNGQHMTQNGYFNTEVVKKQWGFEGLIMSDWMATYDGVAAANGGLDLEMPSGAFMNRETLLPAIKSGKVSQTAIDDKVRRILRVAVQFGWLDQKQQRFDIPLDNLPGSAAAQAAAQEAMVLLKNDRALLPLSKEKVKSVAVIGPDAYPAVPVGGGSAQVAPFSAVSFMEGLSSAYGSSGSVFYSRGIASWNGLANATRFVTAEGGGSPGLTVESFDNADLSGTPVQTRKELHISQKAKYKLSELAEMDMGELFADLGNSGPPAKPSSTRWSGFYDAKQSGLFEVFANVPGEQGGYRLLIDGKPVFDDWTIRKALIERAAVQLDAGLHKVVFEQHIPGAPDVFGGAVGVGIAAQAEIVDPAAKTLAAQSDAAVICVGFGPESESESADRSFGLPFGQDELIREIAAVNKNTVVVITSGGAVDTSPWLDSVAGLIEAWYPGQNGGAALARILMGDVNPSGRLPISYASGSQPGPSDDSYYPEPGTNRVVYKDGIFVGYRGYEHKNEKPAFPFGYGLSYTEFGYSNVAVKPGSADGSYAVSFDVANKGQSEGSDVAQLYVAPKAARVERPVKELKGFVKVELKAGETKHVTIPLDARSFAYFDVQGKQWLAEKGSYGVLVGRSSQDIQLRDEIALNRDIAIPVGGGK